MSGITLRQLEIFAQVVEHGSFRRCAERVGVSQVSISEHVRELESRLGTLLFDRHSGGPSTLTPDGQRAHRRVVTILADLNDLMWDASGGRAGVSRKMTVAMHPYFMRYVGEELVEFRKSHGDVEIKLDLVPSAVEKLVDRVNARELDLVYFFAFDGQRVPDSEVIRIEPLALFVSPTHPLAQYATVTPSDIHATPVIHLGPENLLRKLVDRALLQAGIGGSPVALETDEYGLMLTWLQRNYGFACMFASAAEESHTGGLVRLRLEHPLPALQVCRLMRHSARHDPLAQALEDALTRRMKEAVL